MGVMRSVLLAGSQSVWLRERATKYAFVQRAVRRFMPGEEFDDMLRAAEALRPDGIDAVFTRLGENVVDPSEADEVTRHYVGALDRIRAAGIVCEPSVKLTQLGLDLDKARCVANVRTLAERAQATGNYLWIDMEQSPYVDMTLDITRRVRAEFANVGVCLQAYLHRTAGDLEAMAAIGAGVRLVKGAYNEPPEIAMPSKQDVDASYLSLAKTMIAPETRRTGLRAVFGTHDTTLIARIRQHAAAQGVAPKDYEFHMLYGIQRAEQVRLAREGAVVLVLIAYGSYWFPWYMRRLAERPANVWFVAKSLFS
jgi:proline dehydrogenase